MKIDSFKRIIEIIRKIGSNSYSLMKIYRKLSHFNIILRDLLKVNNKIYSDNDHLQAAMEWLCRAQDITECGGVSGGYSFVKGWMPPYPETTGYIIPTFLQYGSLNDDINFTDRAIAMGNWEIKIQIPSGAVSGGIGINEYPIVFNTGQVILGWTSLYRETKLNRFLDAAVKAANWLISVQDDDGKWSKYTYMANPHVYHTRVAWPLLEVYKFTNDEKYKISAKKQIFWALAHARKNAWFSLMGFTSNETPLTHTIAYTLRGLIESSCYLEKQNKEKIVSVVRNAAEKIMMRYELRKKDPYSMPMYLYATLNEKWKSKDNYSCLTGNAQIAILWLKLYKISNDARFLNAALKLIDQVKATQLLDGKNFGIRGGIAGSYPIWGKYGRFSYLSWPTKFFADAIMLQESIMKKMKEKGN